MEGGAEAVAQVAQADFDVVLMDLRMPEVDGLEATRRIRAMAGPRAQVPIIALTAEAFAEQIDQALQAGMVGHLAKPFTQAELLAVLAAGFQGGSGQGGSGQGSSGQGSGGRDIVATVVAPGPEPADPPPFDPQLFETNAGFLAAASLVRHLQNIVAGIETVLRGLRAVLADAAPEPLVERIHALAGSAGMLGFARLSHVARQYEHAVHLHAPETGVLGPQLVAALEAALPVAHAKLDTAETELRRQETETAVPLRPAIQDS